MASENLKNFFKVKAFHPNWTGALLISENDDEIQHEGTNSLGKYNIIDNTLYVEWMYYGQESYKLIQGSYYHEQLVSNLTRIYDIIFLEGAGAPIKLAKISIYIPEYPYEVTLRIGTSDVHTFHQVFLGKEYDSSHLPEKVNRIVDLGGNIGLGSIFFALRYPDAKLLVVEPDRNNFALLQENIRALGERIEAHQAAVWIRDGLINFHTETNDGRDLEAWGGQVSEESGYKSRPTVCYKLKTLLDNSGFDTVDILKVDIEGAELELFSQEAETWLDRIKFIIVETHDRFRSGSEAAVRTVLANRFQELPPLGENLIFVRLPIA
ncbi:FkbM family methyltransferase [Methylobacterium goesingense]|uniref:FkbM family methyltransferase n=1 Tax=Methylobacterium goesingense TaxID=243690 RepID=A0ABV2L084_9HYPH|nr:FkbM family methyltransferase [Methylobacterium goesingense]GJD75459.1 hypothetical protein CFIICLFH_3700 [Methylobacterium goesingense]